MCNTSRLARVQCGIWQHYLSDWGLQRAGLSSHTGCICMCVSPLALNKHSCIICVPAMPATLWMPAT